MLQSANAIEIRGKLQIADLPLVAHLQKLAVPEKHEDFRTCFHYDKKMNVG